MDSSSTLVTPITIMWHLGRKRRRRRSRRRRRRGGRRGGRVGRLPDLSLATTPPATEDPGRRSHSFALGEVTQGSGMNGD